MKKKFTLLTMLCLLLLPAFLAAKDTAVRKKQLVFTPVTLTGSGISASLMNRVVTKITGPLDGENFFIINSAQRGTDKITPGKCLDNQCIAELAGITPDGIVIIISITSEKVKTSEKVVSRYMDADMEGTRYTIQAVTADILNKKYDLVFKKTLTNSDQLLYEAGVIGKAIRKFYIKRKPSELKTGEDKPVTVDSEPVDYYNITGTTINTSMMYPFGGFSNIANYGIGLEAVLNGMPPVFPYLTVDSGVTFYWLSPAAENINSVYMILPELTFCYRIRVSEKITLGPAAGAGYAFTFIDAETDDTPEGSVKFYYNPVLKAGIEAAYALSLNYSIYIAASYRCMFETDSVLQSADIKLGIRMNL